MQQPGVGQATRGASVSEISPGGAENVTARDILGPDTVEGQSLWIMVAGLAILFLVAAPGEGRGVLARAKAVGGFLLAIAAAEVVVNYTARWYSYGRPDRPFAMGVATNL
jgi:hypothetical protein